MIMWWIYNASHTAHRIFSICRLAGRHSEAPGGWKSREDEQMKQMEKEIRETKAKKEELLKLEMDDQEI